MASHTTTTFLFSPAHSSLSSVCFANMRIGVVALFVWNVFFHFKHYTSTRLFLILTDVGNEAYQNQNQKPFNVPQTGKFFFVATAEYYKEYYLCFTSPQWQTFQHDPILGKPAYRSSTDQITKAVQRHSPCIQSLHVTHKQQPLCIPKPLNQSKMKVISHKHLL